MPASSTPRLAPRNPSAWSETPLALLRHAPRHAPRLPSAWSEKRICELKLTNEAARLALNQLIERGIARNRGRFGRELVFAAEEIIALLSRPFGSDVVQALKEGQRALRKNAKPSNSR